MWGWLGTELPASLLSQALNCMNCTILVEVLNCYKEVVLLLAS